MSDLGPLLDSSDEEMDVKDAIPLPEAKKEDPEPISEAKKQEWAKLDWDPDYVEAIIITAPETIKLKAIKGDRQSTFTVLSELLCHFSPYYRAVLKGDYVEKGKDLLEVDVDTRVLEIVIAWMYTGTFLKDHINRAEDVIEVYIFADKYDFLGLRRVAIGELGCLSTLTVSRMVVGYSAIGLAYASLPANSPLLRYLAVTYINHWTPKCDNPDESEDREEAPAAFLSAVLVGKTNKDNEVLATDGTLRCDCCFNTCNFHEHVSKEEKKINCG